jgi:hypothetical protein
METRGFATPINGHRLMRDEQHAWTCIRCGARRAELATYRDFKCDL